MNLRRCHCVELFVYSTADVPGGRSRPAPRQTGETVQSITYYVEYDHLTYVCLSSLCVCVQMLRPLSSVVWTASLRHHSSYSEDQLVGAVHTLQRLHWDTAASAPVINSLEPHNSSSNSGSSISISGLRAVLKRYERSLNHRVALIQPIRAVDLRINRM